MKVKNPSRGFIKLREVGPFAVEKLYSLPGLSASSE